MNFVKSHELNHDFLFNITFTIFYSHRANAAFFPANQSLCSTAKVVAALGFRVLYPVEFHLVNLQKLQQPPPEIRIEGELLQVTL